MTTASDLLPPPADTSVARRPSDLHRFVGAFVLSVFTTLGLAGAAVLAYDVSHDGRILPGVRVGSVDLSGLDRPGRPPRSPTASAHTAKAGWWFARSRAMCPSPTASSRGDRMSRR